MSLDHYLAVRDRRQLPRFMQARHTAALPLAGNEGWQHHAQAVDWWRTDTHQSDEAEYSLLDLKIELATQMLDACDLCPHHCLVDRNRGKVGYCGVADQTAVHWEGILHGEEIELVPSHEVFVSGCTMRCAFCYSHEYITRPMSGQLTTPEQLAEMTQRRFRRGATNLNLVGGEPTVHIPNILRALQQLEERIPIVWNSNMYITPQAMELLDGVVDLYLGDIHFGNDDCADKLGRIPNYFGSVTTAIKMAAASGASVVIRHLTMPGHLECCARPAMEWAMQNLPQVPFHLMFQYIPDYRAEGDPVLGRVLSIEEIEQARGMAQEIGVNLYQAGAGARQPLGPQANEEVPKFEDIGDTVDVLIHADGRIAFMRLTDELLPIMAAFEDTDKSVVTHAGAAIGAAGDGAGG